MPDSFTDHSRATYEAMRLLLARAAAGPVAPGHSEMMGVDWTPHGAVVATLDDGTEIAGWDFVQGATLLLQLFDSKTIERMALFVAQQEAVQRDQ